VQRGLGCGNRPLHFSSSLVPSRPHQSDAWRIIPACVLYEAKGMRSFAPQFEVIQRIASEQNIFLVPADCANSSGHTGLFRVIENLPNLLIRSRALPVFGTPHRCNTLKLLKRVR